MDQTSNKTVKYLFFTDKHYVVCKHANVSRFNKPAFSKHSSTRCKDSTKPPQSSLFQFSAHLKTTSVLYFSLNLYSKICTLTPTIAAHFAAREAQGLYCWGGTTHLSFTSSFYITAVNISCAACWAWQELWSRFSKTQPGKLTLNTHTLLSYSLCNNGQ